MMMQIINGAVDKIAIFNESNDKLNWRWKTLDNLNQKSEIIPFARKYTEVVKGIISKELYFGDNDKTIKEVVIKLTCLHGRENIHMEISL